MNSNASQVAGYNSSKVDPNQISNHNSSGSEQDSTMSSSHIPAPNTSQQNYTNPSVEEGHPSNSQYPPSSSDNTGGEGPPPTASSTAGPGGYGNGPNSGAPPPTSTSEAAGGGGIGPPSSSGAGGGEFKPLPQGQPKRLHVSNIPFRFREPDLRQLFFVSGRSLLVAGQNMR